MQICLYGASSAELDPVYYDAAYAFGRAMAARGHALVYGGGAQGVMGAAARGVKDAGGRITGVAPRFLDVPGILFQECDALILTDTMAERKAIMMEQADAFVMAPGGIGTFEEFFEILTLKQLGRHNPPIAVYNVKGYFDPLQAMLEWSVKEHFAKPVCLEIYRLLDEPAAILDYFERFDPNALDVRHIKNI